MVLTAETIKLCVWLFFCLFEVLSFLLTYYFFSRLDFDVVYEMIHVKFEGSSINESKEFRFTIPPSSEYFTR